MIIKIYLCFSLRVSEMFENNIKIAPSIGGIISIISSVKDIISFIRSSYTPTRPSGLLAKADSEYPNSLRMQEIHMQKIRSYNIFSSIYDPVGFLQPLNMKLKVLLQGTRNWLGQSNRRNVL